MFGGWLSRSHQSQEFPGAESSAALDDFKKRVEAYEAQYEPLQVPGSCGEEMEKKWGEKARTCPW